jgi:hypothetical protein
MSLESEIRVWQLAGKLSNQVGSGKEDYLEIAENGGFGSEKLALLVDEAGDLLLSDWADSREQSRKNHRLETIDEILNTYALIINDEEYKKIDDERGNSMGDLFSKFICQKVIDDAFEEYGIRLKVGDKILILNEEMDEKWADEKSQFEAKIRVYFQENPALIGGLIKTMEQLLEKK